MDLISSTQNMPAIKVIMNFKTNWWDISHNPNLPYKSMDQMRGVSVTDLPIRQTLYFGTNTDNLLLASYNDMITTEYWTVLQKNFLQFNHIEMENRSRCMLRTKRENKVLNHEKKENIAPASEALVR